MQFCRRDIVHRKCGAESSKTFDSTRVKCVGGVACRYSMQGLREGPNRPYLTCDELSHETYLVSGGGPVQIDWESYH
jgi:hypothetical protein